MGVCLPRWHATRFHFGDRKSDLSAYAWYDDSFAENTAHHVGQGSRRVPVFNELLPFIEDARELSVGKGEYLIHRYRDAESNLRTQLHRIIKRAHLEPWPKAFQNLRASRATDLVLHHPMHVVSEWTGHSIETMKKLYLQVTDEHREAALQVKPQLPPAASKDSGSQLSGEAKPNPKPYLPKVYCLFLRWRIGMQKGCKMPRWRRRRAQT